MDRVASAGLNDFKCPRCKARVRVPIPLRLLAAIRAYGAASRDVLCERGCSIKLTLKRTLQPYENTNLSAFRPASG